MAARAPTGNFGDFGTFWHRLIPRIPPALEPVREAGLSIQIPLFARFLPPTASFWRFRHIWHGHRRRFSEGGFYFGDFGTIGIGTESAIRRRILGPPEGEINVLVLFFLITPEDVFSLPLPFTIERGSWRPEWVMKGASGGGAFPFATSP